MQIRIVKKHRAVIGNEHIGHHIQPVNIRHAAGIIYKALVFLKIKRIGHQIVGTEQDHIIVTEFPAQGVKIHVGAVHITQLGVMLIVPPCGRIENDFFIHRQSQFPFDLRLILRRMVNQKVIARIARLQHRVRLAHRLQIPGGNELLRRKGRGRQNILKLLCIHLVFLANFLFGIHGIVRNGNIVS